MQNDLIERYAHHPAGTALQTVFTFDGAWAADLFAKAVASVPVDHTIIIGDLEMVCRLKRWKEKTIGGVETRALWEIVDVLPPPAAREAWLMRVS